MSLENRCRLSKDELKNDETKSSNGNKEIAISYNNSGLAKYKQVEFVEAIEFYNLAIKYYALPCAHYNRGVIKYRMGEFVAAADDFKQALNIEPSFVEAKLGLEHIEKLMHNKIM